MPQQITPPALIDIGSDADAGEWLQALPFASFAVTDYPAHPSDPVAARATSRRGLEPFSRNAAAPVALSDDSHDASPVAALSTVRNGGGGVVSGRDSFGGAA